MIQELLPFIEYTHKAQKALLIVAEDFESEVLGTLIINRLRSNLKIVCVKSPSFGDNRKATMQDIAVFSGGQFISEEAGLPIDLAGQTP
jgi:chaperonin GroEL